MASTIAAITTGVGGIVQTADASGNLSLLSGPNTIVAVTTTGAKVSTGSLTGSYGTGGITTNFAAGDAALAVNTTGTHNSAMGRGALQNNTTGIYNSAVGSNALQNNTTGIQNSAMGVTALQNNTTGSYNSAMGVNGLNSNTTGTHNSAMGQGALFSNTTGASNSAMGQGALFSNTTAVATFGAITGGSGYTSTTYTNVQLTYVSGSTALTYPLVNITVAGGIVTVCTLVVAANGTSGGTGFRDNTTVMTCASIGPGTGFAISPATLIDGDQNSAMGQGALFSNTTGTYNSAMGQSALLSNTTGTSNSAVGLNALYWNTTGTLNSVVGFQAGANITTGSKNVIIGGYTGNAAPINQTGSNHVVLSDGDGNIRLRVDSTGAVTIPGTLTVTGAVTAPLSYVRLNTANGYGSTNTKIRRFTTTVNSAGVDITYADSATLGGTFTINTNGVYSVSYSDQFVGAANLGVSINSTQLSTAIQGVTVANILSASTTASAGHAGVASATFYAAVNDVVRAHTDGSGTGTVTAFGQFTIARVQ